MSATLECWLCDPLGERLALLDQTLEAQYSRALNQPGAFALALPASAVDPSLLRRDALVEMWRQEREEPALPEFVGYLRRVKYATSSARDTVTLAGKGPLGLLKGRVVAYAAGAAQAAKSGAADDVLKALVRENLGSSATDTLRDWTANGLSVAADLGAAAAVERRFAHQEVLEVCQDLAEESLQRGTPLFFDVVPRWSGNTLALTFTTWIDQRGADRTVSSDNPALFGPAYGNLANPVLEINYEDEVTAVYAGGQGEGAYRTIVLEKDDSRIGLSPWGRRERFLNVTSEQTSTGVQSAAKLALSQGRPLVRFSCDLISLPASQYGLHWWFGDRITVEYQGQSFDGWIARVEGRLDGSVRAKFEAIP